MLYSYGAFFFLTCSLLVLLAYSSSSYHTCYKYRTNIYRGGILFPFFCFVAANGRRGLVTAAFVLLCIISRVLLFAITYRQSASSPLVVRTTLSIVTPSLQTRRESPTRDKRTEKSTLLRYTSAAAVSLKIARDCSSTRKPYCRVSYEVYRYFLYVAKGLFALLPRALCDGVHTAVGNNSSPVGLPRMLLGLRLTSRGRLMSFVVLCVGRFFEWLGWKLRQHLRQHGQHST